ncbi:DNA repair and recombination protein RAD52 [Pseudohyphozyma bogoriensis]|nr:DNA repair and recombination protein RAD52 [Pseudohyphozyma bogoriensis]
MGYGVPPPPTQSSQSNGGHSNNPNPFARTAWATDTGRSVGMGAVNPFTGMSLDDSERVERIQALLAKKLGPEYLSTRQGGGGSKLTYIEGWRVINLANEIFGFNGWFTEVKTLEVDFIDFNPETNRFNMGVSAIVRVWLRDGASHEDVGYGKLENTKSKADGLDKCKKEAVTDALKRTLRNFGNLLGNCLYDKAYTAEISKIKPPKAKFDWNELHRAKHINDGSDAASTSNSKPAVAAHSPPKAAAQPPPPPRPQPQPIPKPVAQPPARRHTVQAPPPKSNPAPPPPPPAALLTAAGDGGDVDDQMFAEMDLDLMTDETAAVAAGGIADDSGFVDTTMIPTSKPPAPNPQPRSHPPSHPNSNPGRTPLQIEQARQQEEWQRNYQAQQAAAANSGAGAGNGGAGTSHVDASGRTSPVMSRNQSAPAKTTAASMLKQNPPKPALKPAVAPARGAVPPSAAAASYNSSRPVARAPPAVQAGQLPILNAVGARSGVSDAVASAGGGGGPGFVSARGMKRGADTYDPTPPGAPPIPQGFTASGRDPLCELEVGQEGVIKRQRY